MISIFILQLQHVAYFPIVASGEIALELNEMNLQNIDTHEPIFTGINIPGFSGTNSTSIEANSTGVIILEENKEEQDTSNASGSISIPISSEEFTTSGNITIATGQQHITLDIGLALSGGNSDIISGNILSGDTLSGNILSGNILSGTDRKKQTPGIETPQIMIADHDEGLIEIHIPSNTSFMTEKGAYTGKSLQETPIFVNDITQEKEFFSSIATIHYGDYNKNIYFEEDEEKSEIEISVQLDTLKNYNSETPLYIYSSSDGIAREYHSTEFISYENNVATLTFSTEHLTYFNISTISGDFSINNDAIHTTGTNVDLTMTINGATEMKFGNTTAQRDIATREIYTGNKNRTLSSGTGAKTVYAAFRNGSGDTVLVEDKIIYTTSSNSLPSVGGLALRLDASIASSITQTAYGVSGWNDQSGNNYHARQENTTDNQPDYATDTTISSVLDFNGDSDFFSIENLEYDATSSLTGLLVCTVFKTDFTGAGGFDNWAFLDFDRSEFFNFYIEGDGDLGFSYTPSAGGTQDNVGTANLNDNNWHVGCAGFDGNTTNDTIITADGSVLYDQNRVANGVDISDTTPRYGFIGDGSEATTYNGARNSIYYDGRIAEMVYYEQAVSESDRQDIECYLGEKRGAVMTGCNDNGPPIASVVYSITGTTSSYVIASLSNISETITITNNDGNDTYIFTENGSFTFEFEDTEGNIGTVTAQVDRIIGNSEPTLIRAKRASNMSTTGRQTIWFDTTYTNLPLVLATPTTDNNTNNYPIPQIRNISTTGFQMKLCVDAGDTTCSTTANNEDVDYFIIDQDLAAITTGIQIGTQITTTNGANTAFTFDDGFTTIPYVFTTSQTYNQGINNIAPIAWVDDITTAGANIVGCVHQNGNAGDVNTCNTGEPNETIGRMAIDPNIFMMSGYQSGQEDISNSTWTTINFNPGYVDAPAVMVTQNDDDGEEDPQYPWVRNVTTGSADIRYCEADAAGVCNTHTSEITRWFSIPVSDGQDVCLETIGRFNFTGATSNTGFTWEQQLSGYIQIEDITGYNPGRYTTINISNLTGIYSSISNTNIEIKTESIETISGIPNNLIQLAPGITSYQSLSGTLTLLTRDYANNQNRTGIYQIQPSLRITFPPYQRVDTYTGELCITLYENDNIE